MAELKNCPFCGSCDCLICSMKRIPPMRLFSSYQALCLKCGATTSWYSEKEEAVKNWNRRAENE